MFNWQMPNLGPFIFILILWETFWKGIGLWKAAKKGDTTWFIAIFVINFFGILPIFYLWRTKQLSSVVQDVKRILSFRFKK